MAHVTKVHKPNQYGITITYRNHTFEGFERTTIVYSVDFPSCLG